MTKRAFRYPAAIIIWDDAHSRNQAVEYEEAELIQQHRPEVCMTLGLVVNHDATGVTMYTEETGPTSVRGVSFVPAGMLKSVTYVNLSPIRAKHAKPSVVDDHDHGTKTSG